MHQMSLAPLLLWPAAFGAALAMAGTSPAALDEGFAGRVPTGAILASFQTERGECR
jgi:hypothetical protein